MFVVAVALLSGQPRQNATEPHHYGVRFPDLTCPVELLHSLRGVSSGYGLLLLPVTLLTTSEWRMGRASLRC